MTSLVQCRNDFQLGWRPRWVDLVEYEGIDN